MAKLYVKFNAAVIKEITLAKDEITFGRKPTNDIVIDHPTISGFHGKIKKDGDRYVVEDLNSTNGTFLNGQRVKSAPIKHRDQIGVAGHVMEFFADGQEPAPGVTAAPQAPEPGKAGLDGGDKLPPATSEISTPDLEKQKEILRKSLGIPAGGGKPGETNGARPAGGPGIVRIVSGGVNGQTEVALKDLVTYIGTSDQAAIKIKGFLAPSLAAAISRRPDGYFLKAVKSGYPKVNGNAVKEQILLENGALIEVAGTNMVFYHTDAKKSAEAQKSASAEPPAG
jgi:hypothetical protein